MLRVPFFGAEASAERIRVSEVVIRAVLPVVVFDEERRSLNSMIVGLAEFVAPGPAEVDLFNACSSNLRQLRIGEVEMTSPSWMVIFRER